MSMVKKHLLANPLLQEILIFGVLFILVTLNSWTAITSPADFFKAIAYFFVLYVHVQLHRFILIPAVLKNKKYFLYIVITLVGILIFSGILYLTDAIWLEHKFGQLKLSKIEIYVYHTGTCSLSLIAMLAPFLLLRFFDGEKKQSGVQLALHQMELKMLRAQLNPHFLFNTFNNIYGISLNDPPRVPELILQVSRLMRYQLDNAAKEWASLDDELGFIESYIGLEEERLGSRCDIRYEYENDTPGIHYFISPLLLILFIENAFKHGTRNLANSFVHIHITVKKAVFQMMVENSISTSKGTHSPAESGIGMNNARQRLNIVYGNKYSLDFNKDGAKYSVCLTLPLITGNNAE